MTTRETQDNDDAYFQLIFRLVCFRHEYASHFDQQCFQHTNQHTNWPALTWLLQFHVTQPQLTQKKNGKHQKIPSISDQWSLHITRFKTLSKNHSPKATKLKQRNTTCTYRPQGGHPVSRQHQPLPLAHSSVQPKSSQLITKSNQSRSANHRRPSPK